MGTRMSSSSTVTAGKGQRTPLPGVVTQRLGNWGEARGEGRTGQGRMVRDAWMHNWG